MQRSSVETVNGAHTRGPSPRSGQVALHVATFAASQPVAPSGMQPHGRPGTIPSPAQRWPAGQVPLQNGACASPHGWLPSGVHAQNGDASWTNVHARPVGQLPAQLPGPPPHAPSVVVVVVGTTHPPGPHASQQLVRAPTQ